MNLTVIIVPNKRLGMVSEPWQNYVYKNVRKKELSDEPKVYYIFFSLRNVLRLIIYRLIFRRKVIIDIRTDSVRSGKFGYYLRLVALRMSNAAVVISKEFANKYKITDRRSLVVSCMLYDDNGVDINIQEAAGTIYLGTIDETRPILNWVTSLSKYNQFLPIKIYGKSFDRELIAKIESLDNVQYMDEIESSKVFKEMGKFRYAINPLDPKIYSVQPSLKILEYLYCGCIVLSTNTDGIRSQLSEITRDLDELPVLLIDENLGSREIHAASDITLNLDKVRDIQKKLPRASEKLNELHVFIASVVNA